MVGASAPKTWGRGHPPQQTPSHCCVGSGATGAPCGRQGQETGEGESGGLCKGVSASL